MDGIGSMPLHSFFAILRAAMPKESPCDLLPWKPCIHPVFFVHSVEGLEKGLYIWLRDGGQKDAIKEALLEDFVWERPSGTPPDIELYHLKSSCKNMGPGIIAGFLGVWRYRPGILSGS